MKMKNLQWKKASRALLLAILLTAGGITQSFAQEEEEDRAYSYPITAPSGQTIYYRLQNGVMMITAPTRNNGWDGYTKPSGSLIIPDSITASYYDGNTYPVTQIGDPSGALSVFQGCSSLTGVHIPNTVTIISNGAFLNSGLRGSLVIPNSVISIGAQAFQNTLFNGTLTLGNSVTTLGTNAFENCKFIGTLNLPNSLKTIGAQAFWKCSAFTGDLIIPESVTYIGSNAFAECPGFNGSLVIPESVTYIANAAFYNCTNLTGSLIIPNSITNIFSQTFFGCNHLTSITLPATITDIREKAFANCSNISSIYVHAGTPPTIHGSNPFSGINNSIPVYIPLCSIDTYSTTPGWNYFTNYNGRSYYYFVGTEDASWSNPSNWTCEIPSENDTIFIVANCEIDDNVTIGNAGILTICKRNSLYINSGKSLTIDGILNNNGTAANLIIEDGGQLRYDGSIAATLKKEIVGYGTGTRNNYFLIASPMEEELDATEVNGLLTQTYDLYTFDQSEVDLEWRNYKTEHFAINNTTGLLYASQANTTVEFAGNTIPSGTDITVDLTYDAGCILKGWNLVGNPFVCQAYTDKNFYVLNAEGRNFINGRNIMPGQAILVQAIPANQTITFTADPSQRNAYIELNVVNNADNREGSLLDNARIRFGEGYGMDKFYLNGYGTRIFIPQDGKDLGMVYTSGKNEIPIHFNAETDGTYTINADLMNVETDYLHLIDNLTGNDIDLLTTSTYTFKATTSDYISRFKLVLSPEAMQNSNSDSFAFIANGEFIIANEGMATLQVIDLTGRILSSETINDNFNMPINLSNGVYMLRLINGNSVKTQRIVVE